MRATYEDLLRVARRAAVEVHQETLTDPVILATGWQAVLTATRRHVAWLRGRLLTPDPVIGAPTVEVSSLQVLAQAIGTGADLLAIQDARRTTKLTDAADFTAARAEVASIAMIAASAVLQDINKLDRREDLADRLHTHLVGIEREFEQLAKSDRIRKGLGDLGNLTTGGPRMAADIPAVLARAAARWHRTHEATAPMTLLTRDLRSMTAQLRTAGGYAWHLADLLLSADRRLDLGLYAEHQLKTLLGALSEFEAGSARVARSWQRRLSDVSGQSVTPGEAAFLELAETFNRLARRGDHLLRSEDLVPDARTAIHLLDALDELVYSTERIARLQVRAVRELVVAGRLYVPLAVLVRSQPMSWPTGIGSRHKPLQWVMTTRPDCFVELTEAVGVAADRLLDASTAARIMAGTANHRRPSCEFHSVLPLSALERESPRGGEVAVGIELPPSAQEFDLPDR